MIGQNCSALCRVGIETHRSKVFFWSYSGVRFDVLALLECHHYTVSLSGCSWPIVGLWYMP